MAIAYLLPCFDNDHDFYIHCFIYDIICAPIHGTFQDMAFEDNSTGNFNL